MRLVGGQIEGHRCEARPFELLPRQRMQERNQRVRIPVRFEALITVGAHLEMKLMLAVEPGLGTRAADVRPAPGDRLLPH